ncbi:MAG: histidine triad nucleotide-binding protein [Terriglobales bacterium]
MSSDCLFCKIVSGQLPAKKAYEDDRVFAFHDLHPGAPTHVLIVPKRHLAGLAEAAPADEALLGHLQLVAARLAGELGLERGYRTVINVGPHAGQSVFHLHLHLLGGRAMAWPPG